MHGLRIHKRRVTKTRKRSEALLPAPPCTCFGCEFSLWAHVPDPLAASAGVCFESGFMDQTCVSRRHGLNINPFATRQTHIHKHAALPNSTGALEKRTSAHEGQKHVYGYFQQPSLYVSPSPFLPQHRPHSPSAGVVRVDVLPAGNNAPTCPALGTPRSPRASGLVLLQLMLEVRGSGADGVIPGFALSVGKRKPKGGGGLV